MAGHREDVTGITSWLLTGLHNVLHMHERMRRFRLSPSSNPASPSEVRWPRSHPTLGERAPNGDPAARSSGSGNKDLPLILYHVKSCQRRGRWP